MTETCSACGAETSGRFCTQCGAAVSAACRECGNPLPKGARFCNQCGTPASPGEAGKRPSPLPWVVAGVSVAALVGFAVFGRGGADEAAAPAPLQGPVATAGAGAGAPPGDARSVDLSSMTPREAADRLFNRVMENVATGDTAAALQFQPMAVDAYGRVPALDLDGRYHLAVLRMVGGQFAEARAQADTILAASGTHLFGLFTAAQAETALGNRAAAQGFYRRFLDAYPAEIGKDLPEYRDHAQGFPSMREEAEAAVAATP